MDHLRHLTHFGHKNICKGVSEWDSDDCRDFNTIDEMNIAIVKGINDNVKQDDILIHLGDWSFGGIDNIWNFRKQINCKNIYLCYGNHDQHIQNNKPLPEELVEESDYLYLTQKDLFTYIDYVLNFTTIDSNIKSEFFCSHYSHRIWDKKHKGRFHIFGHSHGKLNDSTFDKSIDAGIDSAFKIFGEYRPFNIKEIYDMLKNKENVDIDHHKNIN